MSEFSPRIRVLIVDDHPLMRIAVRMALGDNPDFEVVGEAKDGKEMVELARQQNPDVIIVDISMPEMSGLEATRRVTEEMPQIRIVGLTAHEDEQNFHGILKAGALGYVVKGAPADELLAAIQATYLGRAYISPSFAKKLMENHILGGATNLEKESLEALTDREQQVLLLIAGDRTGREIAETLVISINTVDRHRTNIMKKLNVHRKTELVKYAIREGLIKP